ncbi:MAG: hypothetical protein IIC75_00690 [Bacteroidetes bacterium]|nr:hypothetical protein [Bacteroidota bacterium]
MDKINELLNWFNENEWLNLIFFILAIISIIFSILFYLKNKKRKIPTYLIKSFNLIRNNLSTIEEVKIFFSDKEVQNLTVSKIAIWNRGNDVINKSDVAPMNPISLKVDKHFEILNAKISYIKNKTNNFSITVSEDRKSILLDFDYFYKNDGLTIDVYHTGFLNDSIYLDGTIKDAPKFSNFNYNKEGFLMMRGFDKLEKVLGEKIIDKYLFLFIILFFPIIIPITFIEGVIHFFNKLNNFRIPKEYSLLEFTIKNENKEE